MRGGGGEGGEGSRQVESERTAGSSTGDLSPRQKQPNSEVGPEPKSNWDTESVRESE